MRPVDGSEGMRVHLVGTGAADGWPNPFCRCGSCAAQQRAGIFREPTAVLVDDVVLLDCGPQAPARARAQGGRPEFVEHIVIGHDHPDHSAPMALLTHTWAAQQTSRHSSLHVWGTQDVVSQWSQWCGPEDPVSFHVVAAGEKHTLSSARGDYLLRVHAAAHDTVRGQGVLLDLTGPTGDRVLYATDTGPIPTSTREALTGSRFDLVALELTFGPWRGHGTQHLDLTTFAAEVAWMRDVGTVDDATVVVPVHLSHQNPPEPWLESALRRLGVAPWRDGQLMDLSNPGGVAPRHHVTLVTGGVRSGKSRHAEAMAEAAATGGPAPIYVATGPAPDGEDDAWSARVAAHRERRAGRFDSVESGDAAGVLWDCGPDDVVLVDCLGTWLTAQLDHAGAWSGDAGWEQRVRAHVDELVEALSAGAAHDVVVVTNEVGAGVVPATAAGRLFADWLGMVNCRVAEVCDRLVLMVAGRPLDLPPGSDDHG